jgi:hypothetical protein
MTVGVARRLPGFAFEVQPPPLDEVLPRLDIAAFVGFAASGPLHTPVVVEDPAHFAEVFGQDAPLAWDAARQAPLMAQLAPAVRAFFRNGGRRAWIVRVAGAGAVSNCFPIPGLARIDGRGNIEPGFARARSAGSWSDSLGVTAALASRFYAIPHAGITLGAAAAKRTSVAGSSPTDAGGDLQIVAPSAVTEGDLLRLDFNGGDDILFATVAGGTPVPPAAGSPPGLAATRFSIRRWAWFRAAWKTNGAPATGTAWAFIHDATGAVVESKAGTASPPGGIWSTAWPADPDSPVTLLLQQTSVAAPEPGSLPSIAAPAPGSLLRVDFGGESLWFRVQAVAGTVPSGSPVVESLELNGQGLWAATAPPGPNPAPPSAAARLSFELGADQGGSDLVKVAGLTFCADHPNYWDALPVDERFYAETDISQAAQQAAASSYAALWQLAAQPRFPLAGGGPDDDWFVPIGMAVVPDAAPGPEPNPLDSLSRDGLASFDAGLFLDPRPNTPLKNVIGAAMTDLPAEVEYLRFGLQSPPTFTGIYTLFDVDEATIVAVPDAIHRTWSPAEPAPMPPPIESPQPIPGASGGGFLDCGLQSIPAPVLAQAVSDPTGTFTLTWTVLVTIATDALFRLREATEPDFGDEADIAVQAGRFFTVYGRPRGDYYYRVRAETAGATGPWSNGIGVRVSSSQAWQVDDDPVKPYSPDALLAVQRALLRMCGARGDLFAVLSMPAHFREDDAIGHAAALQSPAGHPYPVGAASVAPIDTSEDRALSYAAIYHPWAIAPDDGAAGALRWLPPDGFACGILSLRSATRGPWIAPANQPWTGPVDLTPPIARARRLDLQTAQVNLVRQEPHGFVTLSADTLGTDDDLRPINVRRLLILLRRLALRLGATYVFEPNNDAFRRMVRRGFESVLEIMFLRGAFAGDTRASSFQVIVTSSPEDVDAGRFIVELRVAPSLPLTFMTIRLIQAGDRGLVSEGS